MSDAQIHYCILYMYFEWVSNQLTWSSKNKLEVRVHIIPHKWCWTNRNKEYLYWLHCIYMLPIDLKTYQFSSLAIVLTKKCLPLNALVVDWYDFSFHSINFFLLKIYGSGGSVRLNSVIFIYALSITFSGNDCVNGSNVTMWPNIHKFVMKINKPTIQLWWWWLLLIFIFHLKKILQPTQNTNVKMTINK